MPEGLINNPNDAFGYTEGEQTMWRLLAPCKNTGATAISKGDVLAFDVETTDVTGGVHQADTDNDDPAMCKTVAASDIAINDTGLMIVLGYAIVNIGSDTPAVGERLAPTTTAGVAASAAADANTIAGDTFATTMSVEHGTSNQCACWVGN